MGSNLFPLLTSLITLLLNSRTTTYTYALSSSSSSSNGIRSSTNSGSNNNNQLFANSRTDVLNLLHHPLQLQLATGDLPLGSFRRLILDRSAILEGLSHAVGAPSELLNDEIIRHRTDDARKWLAKAEASGKTISVTDPEIKCYSCGGDHLNVDCPDENDEVSSAALALKSVLEANGPVGASAVLRSYSFACARLLEACRSEGIVVDGAYKSWIEHHAERWADLASVCEEQVTTGASSSSSYVVCLSMFYNWIDNEAATTGIRGGGDVLASITDAIEVLEPGYLATRDKHQSFVADINGGKENEARKDAAARKVNAAAAYLAVKKMKTKKEKKE